MTLLPLVGAAATWYLTGIVWLVQRVNYPLLRSVGAAEFAAYEQAHVRRIGPVVGPAMLVEGCASLLLTAWRPAYVTAGDAVLGAALVVVTWASTFLLQVPAHDRLRAGFDAAWHHRLVRSNRIRTAAWTLHSLLATRRLYLGLA